MAIKTEQCYVPACDKCNRGVNGDAFEYTHYSNAGDAEDAAICSDWVKLKKPGGLMCYWCFESEYDEMRTAAGDIVCLYCNVLIADDVDASIEGAVEHYERCDLLLVDRGVQQDNVRG